VFQAWNAAFEYNILKYVLELPVKWEQMIDSMAIAAANNIPQNLEEAAIFVGAMEQKDPVGKRLIQKLSKPNSKGLFNTDFLLLDQMYEYCKQDVRTEMAIVKQLRPLTDQEQQIWILTQKINERGVPVDVHEAQNAISTVNSAKDAVNAEMLGITGHINANQVPLLLGWLNAQGMDMANLTYETVTTKLLDTTLPKNIRRALELRQLGSQTSVAKYEKMLDVQEGGRIRNTLVYHGASTGRWASRGGLNLQNIARPTLGDEALERAIERVLEKGEGGTMEELSSLVRSVIKAPYGQTFVDVDFSSIENRVASWIAGQTDKVELFRQGLDEYKAFASSSLYQVPYEEVTKEMRQISKSAVLGCMFGQGYKGLVKYAEGMGVKLTEVQSKDAVDAYRLSYAKVKNCWYECERNAISAINNPNQAFQNGKLLFKFAKDALWMKLPSGRLICWRDPKVEQQLTPRGFMREGVTVRSQNTFTRQWSRNNLIGSSIFQSAVQGTARDMLANAMLNLDINGYNIINSIHDEVMLLVDEDKAEEALENDVMHIMTTPPLWASDFPLAAEGWVGKRYRK
jgi:DNA polymerase